VIDYEIASAGIAWMRKNVDSFKRTGLQTEVAFSAVLYINPDLVFWKGETFS